MQRALGVALAAAVFALASCSSVPPDPLQLDRGTLTVSNRTSSDWNDVEIWINRYYRVAVPKISAGQRFQVRLDSFVSGYSQRFDMYKAVIKDLRLTAKQPDGTPVLLTREPTGLDALGSKRTS
jgi:hypothetical protein